jgi:26S proteasome regulatory subunit N1
MVLSNLHKVTFADVLSVLGMTYSDEERLDSLKYRLLAPTKDPGSWGHEYVRHLALEIGTEYAKRQEKEQDVKELIDLALSLVPFFLKHNAEADAVDLLYEVDSISQLPPFLDENTYARVCLYMARYEVSKELSFADINVMQHGTVTLAPG